MASPGAARRPTLWLLLGDKRGDNAQVEALADALGWPGERRTLAFLPPWDVEKPRFRVTRSHVDLDRSDRLQPPWPDLILTVGRRPAMVALWVAEQSGGRTKVVMIGKPSGLLSRFDLVITSAEVQIPALANVLRISLPLLRVDEAAVSEAAEAWRPRWAALPRPLVAVLVGGPTNPFVYDASVTERLLALVDRVAATGGTPYVTTSRRTPEALTRALEEKLPDRAQLYRWAPDAKENPYRALLGLAEGFVVTADSLSMLVEVVRLRRPLQILPLPTSRLGAIDGWRRAALHRLFEPARGRAAGRVREGLGRGLHRIGVAKHTRDFTAFHAMLIDRGLARWAGEGFQPPDGRVPDDLETAAERVRSLFRDASRGA